MSERVMDWPTPRNTDGDRGGRGDLLARVRNYRMVHNGTADDTSSNQLTLFAEAFPANPTRSLVDVAARLTSATSGPSSPESFASFNPDGSWRKTCQGYSQLMLDGSLEAFSETWPRAGMTRNGIAYQRQPSAPLTDETASGLWPTPTEDGNYNRGGAAMCKSGGSGARAKLRTMTTPQELNGALNPMWVEWLMGYPLGWTVCDHSATASSRRSLNGSRTRSLQRNLGDTSA